VTPKYLMPAMVLVMQAGGCLRASISEPALLWGPTVVGSNGGSAYYLNDSVFGGNVLGARITYGPYEQDTNGTVVAALVTSPLAGAKSAVRLGDFVYFAGDSGGIYRTQVANTPTPWATFTNCTVPGDLLLETIATDGTLIFGSTTAANSPINAYSVNPVNGELTLVWSTSNIVGRVRGIDWDASGYLYAADGGGPAENATNNTAHIYAIDAASGAMTDMGTVAFNGRQYQTLREGDQLLLFDSYTGAVPGVPSGQMYVYNLADDTTLVSNSPVNVWDPAGISRVFGAAIDGEHMWLTSINGQTFGYVVPEPGTVLLLLCGAATIGMAWSAKRKGRGQ